MKTFQQATGFKFYTIPDLCHCGCGNILFHRGQKYISGHDAKYCPYWKGKTKLTWNKNVPCKSTTKKKISDVNKGKIAWNKGLKNPISEKRRKKLIGQLAGNKHWNWQGGISFLPYCQRFNKILKTAIKDRDNHTCQLCGTNKKLMVHHIHYDKENCYPDLITLCNSDNSKVNFNRKHYEHLFMNKLNDRGLLFWTLSLYKEKTDNDERTEE